MTIRSVPRFRATVIAFAVTILVATTLIGAHVDAAPTGRPTAVAVALQNPGWTTNTFLANLADAGIPIYAPTYIPDPFSALPSIDAGPVYYSLYWVVPGAPPTYLRITGERDGVIPGYSYYDRNKPLEQNTTVLGYPAWHDETPIYDLLYVDIDGVVYTIESRNLGSDSSISIAASLALLNIPVPAGSTATPTRIPNDGTDILVPTATPDPLTVYDSGNSGGNIVAPASVGSGKVITINVSGITSADLVSDGGVWLDSGGEVFAFVGPGAYEWRAPAAETSTTTEVSIVEPATGDVISSVRITVIPPLPEEVPVSIETLRCPERMASGELITLRAFGSGMLRFRTTDGIFPAAGANPHFAGEGAGLDVMDGVILVERTFQIWLQPSPAVDAEYTMYVFAETRDGGSLAECGIVITPPIPPTYPDMGRQDGTGGVAGLGFATLNAGDGSNIPSNVIDDGSSVPFVSRPIAGQRDTGALYAIPADRRDPDDSTTNASATATPRPGAPGPSTTPASGGGATIIVVGEGTGVGSDSSVAATPDI